jgi:hypothetical protein
MALKQNPPEILKWTLDTAKKYCPKCENTCCDGIRHAITMYENELRPFVERGIPAYCLDNFSYEDLFDWRCNLSMSLFTKHGDKISKPSLIETRVKMNPYGEKNFTLYVDKNCPFYEQKSGCTIHEDERRPIVCKDYPVFSTKDELNTFIIAPSCDLFNLQEVREDFRRNFPEPNFKLAIIKEDGSIIKSAESGLNKLEYGRDIPDKE